MPLHSSKNYHRFEHEFGQKEITWHPVPGENYWEIPNNTWCYYEPGPFDTNWSQVVHTRVSRDDFQHRDPSFYGIHWWNPRNNLYKELWCSCEQCIEFVDAKKEDLVKKYFTADEILATNTQLKQRHLALYKPVRCRMFYYCCCGDGENLFQCRSCFHICRNQFYERFLTVPDSKLINKAEAYAHVMSRAHDTTPFTPTTLNMEYLLPCTLDTLVEVHKQNLIEQHKLKDRQEKAALFAKYGLSLGEYEAKRAQTIQ